jgi:hypothetical protein
MATGTYNSIGRSNDEDCLQGVVIYVAERSDHFSESTGAGAVLILS